MLGRLARRLSFANVCSCLALFVALGTGGAYAANTIGSSDVIDESLTGADIKGHPQTSTAPAVNGSLTGYDIGDGTVRLDDLDANAVNGGRIIDDSITSADVKGHPAIDIRPAVDGGLTGYDIADGSLHADDLAGNAVTGDKVPDGSLTGSDINESTLGTVPNADKLDGIDASGFQKAGTAAISQGFSVRKDGASCPPTPYAGGCFTKVSLPLPPGTYAISAKARATIPPYYPRPGVTASCTLSAEADTDLAEDELFLYSSGSIEHLTAMLPMQLVHAYAATGEAVVDCNSQDTGIPYDNIKITAIKLGQANNTAVP